MRFAIAFVAAALVVAFSAAGQTAKEPSADEQILQTAGLGTDSAALLEFFQVRSSLQPDGDKLLVLARKLGEANADVRAAAFARLLMVGAAAIPALRHVINDLDSADAAEEGRRCLEWLEGSRRSEIPIAAARLLADQKPAAAVKALLAYLPFADDGAVLEGVKSALLSMAAAGGQPQSDLLKALGDPMPLRRAIAVEVLSRARPTAILPEVRKLLADPNLQVRLQVALALLDGDEEEAMGVLIDLIADLPLAQSRLAEEPLLQLAGELSPKIAVVGKDKNGAKLRRDAWADWWSKNDGAALLAEFRKRTLNPEDLARVLTLIDSLGDTVFAKREHAAAELVNLGSKVIPLLRDATRSPDLERSQRAESCLKRITKTQEKQKLPAAAARLLALRQPAGASEALLAYVPFSEDQAMHSEIARALKHLALAAGTPDPILVKTLQDSLALRRAFAAETLAAAGAAEHFPALRKLLHDPDSLVQLRVAVALTLAHDRQAVPALIDLVAELPRGQAWEAEELLTRLAGANAPNIGREEGEAARKQYHEEWTAWWKIHGAAVNLAQLDLGPTNLGYTLVAEMSGLGIPPPGLGGAVNGNDRVFELDRAGKVRWQIDKLIDPVDACVVPGNRVLIAEYAGNRVSERDLKGGIIWQLNTGGSALNVQRLPNGNIFVAALPGSLIEVDRTGKILSKVQGPANFRAAFKMQNGQFICVLPGTCIRLDANGTEIKRFPMKNNGYAGAVHVTPKNTVLVPQTDNTVAEYNLDGKLIWQAKANAPGSATRLLNGHTLVACSNDAAIFELDAAGRVLWEYKAPAGHRPFRARQR